MSSKQDYNILFSSAKYTPFMDYWTSRLSVSGASFQLGQLTERGHKSDYASYTITLDKDKTEAIYKLVNQNELGVFITMTAFLNVLLHRYSGREDIGIYTPLFNKNVSGTTYEEQVLIVEEVSSENTLKEVIVKLQSGIASAYKFQLFPVKAFAESRHLEMVSSDVMLSFSPLHDQTKSSTPLHIKAGRNEDQLTFDFQFDKNVFASSFIGQLAHHFLSLFELIGKFDTKIKDIDLLSIWEKRELLQEYNNTGVSFPEETIVELFEKAAADHPDDIAITYGDSTLTYAELNAKANQLARYLSEEKKVGTGDLVAIYLNRSEWMVISVLAVMKAGAAYVPLDTSYPQNRVEYILENSGATCVITADDVETALPEASNPINLTEVKEQLPDFDEANLGQYDPKSMAYMIYTSGSTGNPKGCVIRHENFANYIRWASLHYFGEKNTGHFGLYTSLAFDLTITSIYVALTRGKQLHVYPEFQGINSILEQMFSADSIVDAVKITPAHIALLKDVRVSQSNVKTAIVGGDQLTRDHVDTLRACNPHIEIYNEYGPTETTVGCIVKKIEQDEPITIGTPIANTAVYILDEDGNLLPKGVEGEICIAGHGVGSGYHNNTPLTKEKFTNNTLETMQNAANNILFSSEAYKPHIEFWKEQLSKEGDSFSLPKTADEYVSATVTVNKETTASLYNLVKGNDLGVLVSLTSMLNAMLAKYFSINKVVLETPFFKGGNRAKKHATSVFIVENVEISDSLKAVLLKQQKTVSGAYKFQDFPVPDYAVSIGKTVPFTAASLYFDQVHEAPLASRPIALAFTKSGDELELEVRCDRSNFSEAFARQFATHFVRMLDYLDKLDTNIADIELLSEEDKKRLLVDFNPKQIAYPEDKTIADLFEAQAEKTPDNIAVEFEGNTLTFSELNEKANQLARHLQSSGLSVGDRVAVFIRRSDHIITSILATQKAGLVYVPIDKDYPSERVSFILEDSDAKALIADADIEGFTGITVLPDNIDLSKEGSSNLGTALKQEDTAYIIYTSGSTGMPKGVEVRYGNLYNFLENVKLVNEVNEKDVMPFMASHAFDISFFEIFNTILKGGKTIVLGKEELLNPTTMLQHLEESTVVHTVPAFMKQIVDSIHQQGKQGDYGHIREVYVGGDLVPTDLLPAMQEVFPNANIKVLYGPTENTIFCTTYHYAEEKASDKNTIGTPTPNTKVYITDQMNRLCPMYVEGEIVLGGKGVAKGYLNRDELTAEKFCNVPFDKSTIYRTGDLGRWNEYGEIEFIGRKDNQVKIRGYRIELGEIENTLKSMDGVQEVVVLDNAGTDGIKYLSAFLVSNAELDASAIRTRLAESLPEYMIPSFFTKVDKIPLTVNGKTDRKALLEMEQAQSSAAYVAPENEVQEKLVELWKVVLNKEKIGINDDFFELGGHSLRATQLVYKINQELNVNLEIRSIFLHPTIKKLESVIEASEKTAFTDITPVATQEYYDLSNAQRRIWVLSQLEDASIAYNQPAAFNIEGNLDTEAFGHAFKMLVERHEILRTVFPMINGEPKQKILRPDDADFSVQQVDVSDENDVNGRLVTLSNRESEMPFDLEKGPLIRAKLISAKTGHYTFMVTTHHIVSDGWSMSVMINELFTIYDALSNGKRLDLKPLKVQYKDFAAWQNEQLSGERLEAHQQYWTQKMSGEIPVLELPTDFPRPKVQTFNGSVHSFEVNATHTEALKQIASERQGTLFMSLLSAINVLMQKYSGQEDIIIGSPIAGRDHAALENQIGLYMNVLALRNQFSADLSFDALFEEVKNTTFEAFEHQQYPFDKLVNELELDRDLSRSPLFDVVIMLQNLDVSLENAETETNLQVSHYEKEHNVSKFDLTFVFVEQNGALKASIEYNTDLYTTERVERMAEHFLNLLENVTKDTSKAIKEVAYLTSNETKLLQQFNKTDGDYPKDKTIVQLFEEQVKTTPDATALVFEEEELTYAQLNEKANQLAHHLIKAGVQKEELVGIFMERSMDMMVGLLGIMKAGAAYVPLDPGYPEERISYIVEDADLKHIVTHSVVKKKLPEVSGNMVLLNDLSDALSTDNPALSLSSENLAYVIYTSGSTGKPKGVLVQHGNVVNFFSGMTNEIGLEKERTLLAVTTISFDISVLEMFWTLTNGFKVVIQPDQKAPEYKSKLTEKVSQKKMDFSLFYFASGEEEGNKYKLLIEGAKFADKHGFSAIWTPERHFHDFGGIYPNPSVTGAAVATITENIQIRSGSCVLPLHNPIRVAEEWSVVDNLSNGRVGLSFATGWVFNDFQAFAPGTYDDRHKTMYEGIETVQRLWQGETINVAGGDKEEHEVMIYPRPVQKTLPFWVTAAGNPETFRSAGKIGANLLTHLLGQTVEDLEEKIKVYREAWKEAGHEGEGTVSLMLHTFVTDDMEQVKELAREPFKNYLKSAVGLIRNLAKAFNMDMDSDSFSEEDMDALLEHAFNRYYNTAALLGTPETCLELVNHLSNIGVDELGCLTDFGIQSDMVLDKLKYLDQLKDMFKQEQEAAAAQGVGSITEMVRDHHVNYLQCTPSMMKIMLTESGAAENLKGLKKLMLGGEALPPELATQIHESLEVEVHNMYGPTETTIWSSTSKVLKDEKVTIGKPILNTQIHILDARLQQVPIGVHGEMYIAGDGVTRGYLNREELTKERFIDNPFGNGKMYKTGDLARWRNDGTIEYIGRNDEQVKIRGHRIELGEIEIRLKEAEGVKDAVVIARGDVNKELVGYVIGDKDLTGDQLKSALGKNLPDYMIPNYFVSLEAFPLTPNGKIDKRKLPEPDGNMMDSGVEYEAPVTRNEQILAKAWEELLGREKVGINDSFFTIGGDSIKAIQVVSRLRQEGLKVEVRDIFNHTTIKELAQHVKEGARAIDQGTVSGEYDITPVQHWHFETYEKGEAHYNHAVMLHFDERVDSAAMQKAIAKIYEHHDVLRTTFKMEEEAIKGVISDDASITLQVRDLSKSENAVAELEAYASELQASLDLTNGPLVRVAHIQLPDSDRLLIVIHHLLVDGISWRVIFEDVDTGYKAALAGEEIVLPLKTESFVVWSEQLKEYAQSEFLLNQKDFWNEIVTTPVEPIKVDYPDAPNLYGTKTSVTASLSEEQTKTLLGEANKAYNTEINDLLLTGFALAMQRWQGHQNTLLSLEGHGREDVGGELDISRTIGWFTSIFPVSLKLGEGQNLGKSISRIKEGMRKIPNKGVGFGVLNYLTDELKKAQDPEIMFNYLGQFDTENEESAFSMASESVGDFVNPEAIRSYLLEINGFVNGGELTITVMYSKHQFEEASMNALLDHYKEALLQIVEHCMSAEDTSYTVSDFAYQDMEMEDLGVEDIDDLFD